MKYRLQQIDFLTQVLQDHTYCFHILVDEIRQKLSVLSYRDPELQKDYDLYYWSYEHNNWYLQKHINIEENLFSNLWHIIQARKLSITYQIKHHVKLQKLYDDLNFILRLQQFLTDFLSLEDGLVKHREEKNFLAYITTLSQKDTFLDLLYDEYSELSADQLKILNWIVQNWVKELLFEVQGFYKKISLDRAQLEQRIDMLYKDLIDFDEDLKRFSN